MLNYFSLQDQSWIYWFPILSKRTQSKEKSLIPLSSIHVVFVTPEHCHSLNIILFTRCLLRIEVYKNYTFIFSEFMTHIDTVLKEKCQDKDYLLLTFVYLNPYLTLEYMVSSSTPCSEGQTYYDADNCNQCRQCV